MEHKRHIEKFKEIAKDISVKYNIKEFDADLLAIDNGFERYVYLTLENELPSLEMLIIIVAECLKYKVINVYDKVEFIGYCQELRNSFISYLSLNEVDFNLDRSGIRDNYDSINDLARISNILKTRQSIQTSYFSTYDNTNRDATIVRIYDAKRDLDINVNIGNKYLRTELGFYKPGYTYEVQVGDENTKIISATRSIHLNQEFGHFDVRGYNNNPDEGWKGIYCR